jgi:FlaA1/EpsC-like NDP-sugar epimerase
MLMAAIELVVLFSSVYIAGIIVCGSIENCVHLLGPIAPKAMLVAVVALVSLVAMGLYQYQQRLYFTEAVVRIIVGLTFACLALAILYYAYPPMVITRDVASIAIGYALLLLIGVRFLFVRTVDENIFRRRSLVYGAGGRAHGLPRWATPSSKTRMSCALMTGQSPR